MLFYKKRAFIWYQISFYSIFFQAKISTTWLYHVQQLMEWAVLVKSDTIFHLTDAIVVHLTDLAWAICRTSFIPLLWLICSTPVKDFWKQSFGHIVIPVWVHPYNMSSNFNQTSLSVNYTNKSQLLCSWFNTPCLKCRRMHTVVLGLQMYKPMAQINQLP